MKDKIVARMKYYKGIAEERAINPNSLLIDKVVHKGKIEVWEQAIGIVKEVMKDDQ